MPEHDVELRETEDERVALVDEDDVGILAKLLGQSGHQLKAGKPGSEHNDTHAASVAKQSVGGLDQIISAREGLSAREDTAGVIALILTATAIGIFFAGVFWYGFRGQSNEGPALGNNSPYPTDISGERAPFLPDAVISSDEEFRRDAHLRSARRRPRPPKD